MKPLPSILQRKEKRQAKAANRTEVYRAAYKRDGYRCRACNDRVVPNSPHEFNRAHPHHLRFRSKGGKDSLANIMTACALCHRFIHAYRMSVAGDANGKLTFSAEGRTPWVSWPTSGRANTRT